MQRLTEGGTSDSKFTGQLALRRNLCSLRQGTNGL
jgi:hypothetical protein